MTLHTSLQFSNRPLCWRPKQHRVPPLPHPVSPSATEPSLLLSTRHTLLHQMPLSFVLSRRSSLTSRNRCSVAAVGALTNANLQHTSSLLGKDVVSYAVQHQLPDLLNNMVTDLLCERPESDVDGWMIRWFEREYKRRREDVQKSAVQTEAQSNIPRVVNSSVLRHGNAYTAIGRLSPTTTAVVKGDSMSIVSSLQHRCTGDDVEESKVTDAQCAMASPQYTIVLYSQRPQTTVLGNDNSISTQTDFTASSGSQPIKNIIVRQPRIQPPVPLSTPSESLQQSAENEQCTVSRFPRLVEFSLKIRSPYLAERRVGGIAPTST